MFCKVAAFCYRNKLNKNLYLTNIQGLAGMAYAIIKKNSVSSPIDFTKKP